MAFVVSRLFDVFTSFGLSFGVAAGLGTQPTILAGLTGIGIPVQSVVVGLLVLVVGTVAKTALFALAVLRARPVRPMVVAIGSVVGIGVLVLAPLLSAAIGLGGTLAIARGLPVELMGEQAAANGLIGMVRTVLSPLPLAAVLIAATLRIREFEEDP